MPLRFFFIVFFCACPALAQERRPAVAGSVLDPTGTAAPAAQVPLRPSAGPSRTVATDESGAFRFEPVDPGNYVVEVTREGFAPASVQVRVGNRSPAPLRIRLQLARVRQEITVAGEAAPVSVEAG